MNLNLYQIRFYGSVSFFKSLIFLSEKIVLNCIFLFYFLMYNFQDLTAYEKFNIGTSCQIKLGGSYAG